MADLVKQKRVFCTDSEFRSDRWCTMPPSWCAMASSASSSGSSRHAQGLHFAAATGDARAAGAGL